MLFSRSSLPAEAGLPASVRRSVQLDAARPATGKCATAEAGCSGSTWRSPSWTWRNAAALGGEVGVPHWVDDGRRLSRAGNRASRLDEPTMKKGDESEDPSPAPAAWNAALPSRNAPPALSAVRRLMRHDAHFADYGSSVQPCGRTPPSREGHDPGVAVLPGKHRRSGAPVQRRNRHRNRGGSAWTVAIQHRIAGAEPAYMHGVQGRLRKSPRSGLIARPGRSQWRREHEGELRCSIEIPSATCALRCSAH